MCPPIRRLDVIKPLQQGITMHLSPDFETEIAQATHLILEKANFRLLLLPRPSHNSYVARCDFKIPNGVLKTKICAANAGGSSQSALGVFTFVHQDEGVVYSTIFKKGETAPFLCDYNNPKHKGYDVPLCLQNKDVVAVEMDTVKDVATHLAKYMKDNPRAFHPESNPFASVYHGVY